MENNCDICGKQDVYLTQIRSMYETENIKKVCEVCGREIDAHLWKLKKMSDKMTKRWLQRFMINLKTKLFK